MEGGLSASIMGIERLRDNVDGYGIRSLVLFDKCPLQCKYCINKMMMQSGIHKVFTPQELYETLKIDSPYFQVSGGGITFGGGEPALESIFIEAFSEINHGFWQLDIETSLNVPLEHVVRLSKCIDRFYVDIKDMNPDTYKAYTGVDGQRAYSNLRWLVDNGFGAKIIVRVPLIPDYNNEYSQEEGAKRLEDMGLKCEKFNYVLPFDPDLRIKELRSRDVSVFGERRLMGEIDYQPVISERETEESNRLREECLEELMKLMQLKAQKQPEEIEYMGKVEKSLLYDDKHNTINEAHYRICPVCGQRIDDDSISYCFVCGTKL